MEKVVSWMTKHKIFERDDNVKNGWLAEILELDQYMVFDLAVAAHFLQMEGLWNLTCSTIAGMMIGKEPEDIRNVFIECKDLTEPV